MSQKKKRLLSLKETCDHAAETIRPSPEKKKRSANGLKNTEEAKIIKPCKGVRKPEKKQQWLLSSFDDFGPNPQLVNTKNELNQQLHSKKKSSDKVPASIDNNVLWCEKYSPLTEPQLAVHKKKVKEVRDWLEFHLSVQNGNGVLLLTGPPGSGKTATLRVLAKELGVEIQEWVNPSVQSNGNDFDVAEWKSCEGMVHRQSQLKNFRDFFLRANKYPCLSLGTSDAARNKKIILVEDIPNIFYRRASELHDILGSSQRCSRNPVVFIVSDSNSNDTNGYRLFPKDILRNLNMAHISFNPASVTSLNKLVKDITSMESKKRLSTSFHTPSKEAIDNLVSGCNGDIRGLINNLQFTCLKGSTVTFQRLKSMKQSRASREKPGKRSSKRSTDTESTSLPMIGGKDTSLYLFRVLGKVLYCKREETSNTTEESLPAHLKHHERPPLVENPEEVFDKSHMSGDNLNLYLHQNYLDFFNNIKDVSVASDYLSDADHLTGEWMHRSTLCCYTTSVAIRGLMFCNQGRGVSQTKNVWRPLHKPKWYDVLKQTRHNNSTALDLFTGHRRDAGQLHCEYIPYLALSDIPLRSPGQINYLQTVCKFSRNFSSFRDYHSNTLQEKEVDDNESEIGSSQPHSSRGVLVEDKEILLVSEVEEDDDIEEFDDD